MSDETRQQALERRRLHQARYRERQRKSGMKGVQMHLPQEDLAVLDAIKSEQGLKSRAEAVSVLVRERLKQSRRSEATS